MEMRIGNETLTGWARRRFFLYYTQKRVGVKEGNTEKRKKLKFGCVKRIFTIGSEN